MEYCIRQNLNEGEYKNTKSDDSHSREKPVKLGQEEVTQQFAESKIKEIFSTGKEL